MIEACDVVGRCMAYEGCWIWCISSFYFLATNISRYAKLKLLIYQLQYLGKMTLSKIISVQLKCWTLLKFQRKKENEKIKCIGLFEIFLKYL